MSLKSLIKINLQQQNELFLSCNYAPGEQLSIVLLDLNKSKAYTGTVGDIDLRSQAATMYMAFSDFVQLTKSALLQKESGHEQFLYSLEKNCSDFLFKWKSIDHEETVVNIGCVKVTENDFSSMVRSIFLTISEELFTINEKMLNMENALLNYKKEKDDALQLLSNTADMKESVEKELFSKFILVLNEKKRKIKELKQSPTAKQTKTHNKRAKASHQISESSDEAASDVDKGNLAVPSTSKKNNSLLFFSDDESDLLQVSPSKRRVRNKVCAKNLNKKEQQTNIKDAPMKSGSESDDLFNDL